MECRAWWSERRERVLALVDINLAVDKAMWDVINEMGLARYRRRGGVDRREVIEGVLGRFHRDGHRLLPAESYDDDEVAAVR